MPNDPSLLRLPASHYRRLATIPTHGGREDDFHLVELALSFEQKADELERRNATSCIGALRDKGRVAQRVIPEK